MAEGITIERTLAAPRPEVWAAWTRPERFAEWFGGDAADIPLDRLRWNPVAGEAWAAAMVLPDGERIEWSGEFLQVLDPVRLEFTMADVSDGVAPGRVAVEFGEAHGGGTEVVITQTGIGTDGDREAAAQAWARWVDVLGRRLAAR